MNLQKAKANRPWGGRTFAALRHHTQGTSLHSLYDSATQTAVLFGGQTDTEVFNATWEWNGTAWIKRFPPTSPGALAARASAYDGARRVVVLFGGSSPAGDVNETWTWDGFTWTRKT